MLAILMGLALQAAPPMVTVDSDSAEIQTDPGNSVDVSDDLDRAADALMDAADRLWLASPFDPSDKTRRDYMAGLKQTGKYNDVWVEVGRSSGSTTFVRVRDIMSIRTQGFAWSKVMIAASKKAGPAISLVSKYQVNCQNETTILTALVSYRADGSVINSSSVPYNRQTVQVVVPDSVGEQELRAICSPE